jgi:hypothetical protein
MVQDQLVTVFNFRALNEGYESATIAPFKATRKAIAEVFKGDIIEGTAEEVAPDELDRDGRYRRLATGWGEMA